MSRILLLGGYGGFGAKIAKHLAAARYEVLVAGRSLPKAKKLCEGNAALIPLELDRADIAAALAAHKPDIVVDASGPFQAMDYTVPRACIAARVHYIDIADGRDFVCGISKLDADAKAAGITIISGASSVPALSGAAVRALLPGMDRVMAVEMAISASNRATAGPAVAAAVLGQVGLPMKLYRGGRWITGYGWQELQRLDFAVPAKAPIRHRLCALVDVPDHQLLPDRLPGKPAVTFAAGTEMAFQNISVWLLSWPVRWGLLPRLSRFASLFMSLQRFTAKLGSDRSAMIVRLFGEKNGARLERRWTLMAEEGHGPEIPALSVPPLVERILAGREASGARDAGLSLDLADYGASFSALSITHHTQEIPAPPPVYRRVMGSSFDLLPPTVRAMHEVWRDGAAEGAASVRGPENLLGKCVARLMRFPPPGDYPLRVSFRERDGVETWTRNFGGHVFSSRLRQSGAHLSERFGPLRFHFDLPADSAGLRMVMRSWSILGIPLPLFLAPRTRARETEEQGRFRFEVWIGLPLAGRIVEYQGWVMPVTASKTAREAETGLAPSGNSPVFA